MLSHKLGFQTQDGSVGGEGSDSLALWQASPVAMSVNCPEALRLAKAASIRIHRHVWPDDHDYSDPERDADLVCDEAERSALADVIVQATNEIKGRLAQGLPDLCVYTVRFTARCHARGHRVAGIGWASGAFEREDWEYVRSRGWCGIDYILLHGYWADVGPTVWNAYRYEQFWQEGDPLVIIGECLRDRVRDGPKDVDDGWIGHGGWIADREATVEAAPDRPADQVRAEFTDAFFAQIVDYSDKIDADPRVYVALGFILRGDSRWTKFELSTLAGRLRMASSETPQAMTGGEPVAQTLAQQFPADYAAWVPLPGADPEASFRAHLMGIGRLPAGKAEAVALANSLKGTAEQISQIIGRLPLP